MKKSLHIVLLLFAISSFSIAQSCLPNGITFTSQQQIDDFPSNYPGCTDIEGDVTIEEANDGDIINLDSLIQIFSVGGSLEIKSNSELISLHGLNNLNNIEKEL